MRNICTITDQEAVEIGNVAFRLFDPIKPHVMGGNPYYSKKWKLHLFEDRNRCEKIAIVDEKIQLEHIDDLWSGDHNDSSFNREPVYDWIEIDRYLVVTHFINKDLNLFYDRNMKILTVRSQVDIFDKLKEFGFFGGKMVLH